MQDFLSLVRSHLAVGQRSLLSRFLDDVQAGRFAGDAAQIALLLERLGVLIDQPGLNVEDPESFNQSFRVLLSNLAGLYQEIDRIEGAQQALQRLNQAELGRIEQALQELSSVVSAAERANASRLQWSDVFFEPFGGDPFVERSRDWYRPLPSLDTGQVEAFLPAYVDPLDRSLKLLPGGDFSRSTNLQGDPLAEVTVEEVLGLSVDREHGVNLAVDGKLDTYWRELILAEAPLQADPLQVPWLPPNYTGGTAARVHFHFPFAVPFTEVQVRPFAHHPTQILQAVWDNRTVVLENRITNGAFSGGLDGWTGVPASGVTVTASTSGGYHNGGYLSVIALSGHTVVSGAVFAVDRTQKAYHLFLKLQQTKGILPRLLLQWYQDTTPLRADWLYPQGRDGEWYEYSHLALSPSGATSGSLTLIADGGGTVLVGEVVFSLARGQQVQTVTTELDSEALVFPLGNAEGTDLWLVLAQPHYDLLHLTLPQGELESQAFLEEVQLQAAARSETVYRFQSQEWLTQSPPPREGPLGKEGLLLREARRLGGRIYQLALGLTRFLNPDPASRRFTRFLYTLGAWEIRVTHREYAPQGLFVSRPYHPFGEVREVGLLTNPPLESDGVQGRLRFWLVPRARDGADRAQEFTGRASFSAQGETTYYRDPTHFTLPPVDRHDLFEGTDRQNRVQLLQHPYVNQERVAEVYAQLVSGGLQRPVPFDGSKLLYYLEHEDSGGNLTFSTVTGYQPLTVTLEFPDGTIAYPDRLGAPGDTDIGYVGPELLQSITIEDEQEQDNSPRKGKKKKKPGEKKGDQRKQEGDRRHRRKVIDFAGQTALSPLVEGTRGVALSVYWHKSSDDPSGGVSSGSVDGIVTSGDILISPSHYKVEVDTGIIRVSAQRPQHNPLYDSFIVYYYYHRTDEGARLVLDEREAASVPTSGIDFAGPVSQKYPVTRNRTDYIHGTVPVLREAQTEDLLPDFYPVYEYYVTDRGALVFANNFHPFGDTPARILVDYASLEIEPRLLVEFLKRGPLAYSTQTPVLHDYTLLMNVKR